jgi:hypothetical protein
MLSNNISEDGTYTPSLGGNKNSIARMTISVEQMNNYCQILWLMIKDKIIELQLFDSKNTEFERDFMKEAIILEQNKN